MLLAAAEARPASVTREGLVSQMKSFSSRSSDIQIEWSQAYRRPKLSAKQDNICC